MKMWYIFARVTMLMRTENAYYYDENCQDVKSTKVQGRTDD